MAVAHDNSDGPDQNNGNGSTFSFTPVGTPRGILVFLINLTSTDVSGNDLDSIGVTYGGVSMTPVTDGYAHANTSEGAYVRAYFLGSGIPTGTQTVEIDGTTGFNSCRAYIASVTADRDTEAVGSVTLGDNTGHTLDEVNVDDGSPGSDSLRYAALHSGLSSAPPAGAHSTVLFNWDRGVSINSLLRETTAGQGSRPVGWSTGSSDDAGAVYLAIREAVVAAASTFKPQAILF